MESDHGYSCVCHSCGFVGHFPAHCYKEGVCPQCHSRDILVSFKAVPPKFFKRKMLFELVESMKSDVSDK
jgi:hypothetical protein